MAAGGGTSATGGGAGGSCAGKSYALCEDFESGTVGAAPAGWTTRPGWGANASTPPTVRTERAHWGARALRSTSDVPGQARIDKALSGAVAQAHWGRLFYRVETPVPLKAEKGYLHLTFAAVQSSNEGRVVDTVEDPDGKYQFLYNVPDDSCCDGSSYDWTWDDAWHCAEWRVRGSEQSYQFFIDGTEVTAIGFSHNAGSKLATLSALTIGSIFYVTPTAAFTSWIDDVAIDSNRIGCGP
jgi:hypothetical protein